MFNKHYYFVKIRSVAVQSCFTNTKNNYDALICPSKGKHGKYILVAPQHKTWSSSWMQLYCDRLNQ